MSTLIRPPPVNPNKSPIENALQLLPLTEIRPDIFTNTRPLWHPPGARGVYGGAVIAQCLIAAQGTIPDDFTVHSMHCYFVLAGNPDVPILYHVEHVREGRSFATRTVQARQRGQPIFTTTLSFVRENSAGSETLKHATKMPDVTAPVEREEDEQLAERINSPMLSQVIGIYNEGSPSVEEKKVRHWVKARGRVSEEGGHGAHLAALAYISDSLFIGTVARIHKAWRPMVDSRRKDGYQPAEMRKRDDSEAKNGPELGMMVSLDHTIYFHNSRAFRADEWMMTEMESPWAGDGRGLVFQRIYTRDGVLVASCVQEGLVRLRQKEKSKL